MAALNSGFLLRLRTHHNHQPWNAKTRINLRKPPAKPGSFSFHPKCRAVAAARKKTAPSESCFCGCSLEHCSKNGKLHTAGPKETNTCS
ncbi:unnamed protein product [Gulo gulo]|uniref:Uncharacterized protein n=1 Tax=Gulo gulo TaxID=48420 RepID=A0A9X9PTZ7_GULGU|nr:unnamed protein product [Gulo gulo]